MQHEGEDESSHNDTVSLLSSIASHTYCLRHVERMCTAFMCLDAASLCCTDAAKSCMQCITRSVVLHWHQCRRRANYAAQSKVAAVLEAGLSKLLTSSTTPTPTLS